MHKTTPVITNHKFSETTPPQRACIQDLDDAAMEEAAMIQRIAERAEEKLKNRGVLDVAADITGTARKVLNANEG